MNAKYLVSFIIPIAALLFFANSATQAADCGGSIPDAAALISAIENATSGDTITLEAGCVYTLTTVNNASNGLPLIDKTLTINGNGATIERSTDGGTPEFRIFEVNASGDLTLNDVTISNGYLTSGGGGGILSESGTVHISDSTLSNNTAWFGGGVAAWNEGVLIVERTLFKNNHGRWSSGGLAINAAEVTITNSTFYGNTAQHGGAMLIEADGIDTITIQDSLITENHAIRGVGGIEWVQGFAITPTNISNTIISGNSGLTYPDVSGEFTSLDYNLIGDTTGVTILGTTTHNQYGIDPMLDVLADNGGPTQTIALLPGSPAIDAGSCSTGTDQRGYSRPVDFAQFSNADVGCDIGPFELQTLPFNAADEEYRTDYTTTLNVSAPGVLANDYDPAGNPLSPAITTPPAHAASFTLNLDGSFSYTPEASWYGTDTFTYTASSAGGSDTATVTINVGPDWNIPCGDTTHLIDAIDHANANGTASTIELAADCTYTFTTGFNINYEYAFVMPHALPPINSPITINGNGATIERSSAPNTPEFIFFWVYLDGDLTLNDITLTNGAGGIYQEEGSLTINNSSIDGNIDTGIACYSTTGTLAINNSSITNNVTDASHTDPGGIAVGCNTSITNSTIAGNVATDRNGGGIMHNGGDLTIINSTIANNTATGTGIYGGGIYSSGSGTVTLRGTIVSGNTATSGGNDIYGDMTSNDYNLIQDTSGATITGTVTNNITNQDPLLGALQDNGGSTFTMALQSGSPAIDAGGACGLSTDQRGALRDATCDIGAFEWQPVTIPVACDANSLISAISTASSGDTITLEAGCVYTLTTVNNASNGLPLIDKTLTIEGNGATVERSTDGGTPSFRIFEVSASGDLTLNDVTIANGYSIDGGGIFNAGVLTLIDANVTNNTDPAGAGGGIGSMGALTIQSSTIANNNGFNGSGIYTGAGTVIIENSTISGNTGTATDSRGGGIWVNDGNVTITNTTIANNSVTGSDNNGGGILVMAGTVDIISSTITDNEADTSCCGQGGGIWANTGASVNLSSSIIYGNTSNVAPNIWGTVNSLDYNLIDTYDVLTTITGTTTNNITNQDPLLGALADNGGSTFTMALQSGSPAIDAGGACGLSTDQRGVTRPQYSACDIGAYEYDGILPTSTPTDTPTNTPTSTPSNTPSPAPTCPDGTAGDDIIICEVSLPDASNADNNINTGAGNDTVTINPAVTVDNIITDEGNDTIIVYGSVNTTIYGEEGDDVFVLKDGFGSLNNDLTIQGGGLDYDILNVDIAGLDQATIDALDAVDTDNPADGTVTVNGVTLTLVGIEEIQVEGHPPNCNGPIYDDVTLLAAINTANSNNQPDTLELVGTCTYTLQNTLTIADDGLGNTLTLHGNGATIDGNTYRIFDVQPGADLAIDNMTLQNGVGQGDPNTGGGLYVRDGTVTIDTVTFDHCAAALGAALASEGSSSVTVSNSTFTNNTGSVGGAIANNAGSHMTLTNSSASNNTATGYPASGGVIANDGLLDIVGGTYQANNAALRGGFLISSGPVTITGATLNTNIAQDDGGAIFLAPGASLLLVDSLVTNNASLENNDLGGAIHGREATITISNSTLSGNSAKAGGGAVYGLDSIIIIENGTTVSGNIAVDEYGEGRGGAIYVHGALGQLTITDSLIDNNTAGLNGGAVSCESGQIAITNSTLSNNAASGYGGAFFVRACDDITITGSTFDTNHVTSADTNSAGYYGGGAIYNSSSPLSVSNSTFTGNTSATSGGALFSDAATTITLISNTIVGNSALNDGGGIYTAAGAPKLQNTLIGDNTAGNSGNDLYGAYTSLGYNFIEDLASASIAKLGTTDITGVAPSLYALADNGGPTQTILPLPDNLTIDAGYCENSTDQRDAGYARVVDHWPENASNGCDIGAVEWQTLPPTCPDGTIYDDVLRCDVSPPLFSNADSNINMGAGNDTLTLSTGVTVENVSGGTGNDTLYISGTINGTLAAEDGDDTVVLRALVNGGGDNTLPLDGGNGFDTLNFYFSLDAATFDALALSDPANGSITIGGQTFNWINFEEIQVLGENAHLLTVVISEQRLHKAMQNEIATNPAITSIIVAVPDIQPGAIVIPVEVNGVAGSVRVTFADVESFTMIQYIDIVGDEMIVAVINEELPTLLTNSLDALIGNHGGLQSFTMDDTTITVVVLRH